MENPSPGGDRRRSRLEPWRQRRQVDFLVELFPLCKRGGTIPLEQCRRVAHQCVIRLAQTFSSSDAMSCRGPLEILGSEVCPISACTWWVLSHLAIRGSRGLVYKRWLPHLLLKTKASPTLLAGCLCCLRFGLVMPTFLCIFFVSCERQLWLCIIYIDKGRVGNIIVSCERQLWLFIIYI